LGKCALVKEEPTSPNFRWKEVSIKLTYFLPSKVEANLASLNVWGSTSSNIQRVRGLESQVFPGLIECLGKRLGKLKQNYFFKLVGNSAYCVGMCLWLGTLPRTSGLIEPIVADTLPRILPVVCPQNQLAYLYEQGFFPGIFKQLAHLVISSRHI